MTKIEMKNPLVEIDGDEMSHVLWELVKEKLILPFVDLKSEYYDLSIVNREKTKDEITLEAAHAIIKHGVGVKCATITANKERKIEYNLKNLYPSPNATICSILDGTVFRKPIIVNGIKAPVANWKKSIIIARHMYGNMYKNSEMLIPGAGKVELVWTSRRGLEKRITVTELPGPGVIQSVYNLDVSIENFARCCFKLAVDEKMPLWFAAKDTLSKTYDGRFKAIFERIYNEEYKNLGVAYTYMLIDDAVSKIMKSEGGIIWACKNYDGDVMSSMLASATGSTAMMTSVLVSPYGVYGYEAMHGTVQRHYSRWKKYGEKTSTNPSALIFAWVGALSKRAELDGTALLGCFAEQLKNAVISSIESGNMTADLTAVADLPPSYSMNSWEFIDTVAEKLIR
ncbi:MAG: NADP-dependent isocitrate dehydrogenase [Spirochaetaceae bacterium]|jgi:isocitrate dehydrogenase|nr:NADP-dependent isocitrate dehydrogenase [Spirochaetaceae bacterium]